MLASAMNTNASGFEQSSAYVEAQVIDWFKELLGFPDDASGLLVSSGSAANLTGLTVVNHRSRREDFAALVNDAALIGRELAETA